MKKAIGMLITIGLIFSLTACGGGTKTPPNLDPRKGDVWLTNSIHERCLGSQLWIITNRWGWGADIYKTVGHAPECVVSK